jgi:hypothetical protein
LGTSGPVSTTLEDVENSQNTTIPVFTGSEAMPALANTFAERELHYLDNEERKIRERREAIIKSTQRGGSIP